MKTYIVLIYLMFIQLLLVFNNVYSQQYITRIDGLITYNVIEDYGIVSLNITFDRVVYDTFVNITLLGEVDDIIEVIRSDGEPLMYRLLENNILNIYVNETNTVSISYIAINMFDEVAIESFAGFIDLSTYRNIQVNVLLYITGLYNVYSSPDAIVSYENGLTRIQLNKPELYFINLNRLTEFSEIIYETTSTPVMETTMTTTETTVPSTREGEREEAGNVFSLIILAIIVLVIIVLLLLATRLFRKK
ncbi:MAG: hypothetical protein QXX35_05325 [Desulfurococcaceae archaeon]